MAKEMFYITIPFYYIDPLIKPFHNPASPQSHEGLGSREVAQAAGN